MALNEQFAPNGIEWTRIRNADGSVRRGFTWNPVAGCLHDCEWIVNGQRAECYAKTIAEKFTGAWSQGFAHDYWHPERLTDPIKQVEAAGIFPDSMADLFGNWVDRLHVIAVLDVMRQTPQHIYQSLTKNAPGLLKYAQMCELPPNLWAGISSPPDHMLGNDLNDHQKERYLQKALGNLQEIHQDHQCTTWMSFEPLSQDWAHIVAQYPGALQWAVIGAASIGRTYLPPEEKHVRNLIDVLRAQNVRIFFKGNMRSLKWAANNWLEEFPGAPVIERLPVVEQQSLF